MKKFKVQVEGSNSSTIITDDIDYASVMFIGACTGLKMKFDKKTNVSISELDGEKERIIMLRLDTPKREYNSPLFLQNNNSR